MTVCVAVRVNDSMVFAADSASTLEATSASGVAVVLNVYRHGDKIFNLCKGLPIAAMTCGMGHIGDRAISSLAKDLRTRLTIGERGWAINREHYTIEEVAQKAMRFLFDERYSALTPPPAQPHLFEFWVGGYSAGSEAHDLWKITIQNGGCTIRQSGPAGTCGVRWGGQPEPITRLVKGFSNQLLSDLVAGGLDPANANLIRTKYTTQLAEPAMPVQDALDLAQFLVETTKGYFRFIRGADVVGGETELAVVTRHEGFKWIKRKHYYPDHLNKLETDHVGQAQASGKRDARGEDARVRISDARLRKPKRIRNERRH